MSRSRCNWFERDEVFEGYVRRALAVDEMEAFEEHFFACEACFDKLAAYRALQAELAAWPAEVPGARPARGWFWAWRWALIPLGAGVILAAGLALWPRPPAPGTPETAAATGPVAHAPSAPVPKTSTATPAGPPAGQEQAPSSAAPSPPALALSVLARVEPPVYLPVALRGPRDEAAERFEAAMHRYVEGDHAGALPGLREAAALSPGAPNVRFFLAICHLLTGEAEPAIADFRQTIALGESPYLEEAHFYLAKALLRRQDIQGARKELEQAAARRGRLEADARRLLAQLESLAQQK